LGKPESLEPPELKEKRERKVFRESPVPALSVQRVPLARPEQQVTLVHRAHREILAPQALLVLLVGLRAILGKLAQLDLPERLRVILDLLELPAKRGQPAEQEPRASRVAGVIQERPGPKDS
jgi:hypothetical protein